jgi:hypothetical protein
MSFLLYTASVYWEKGGVALTQISAHDLLQHAPSGFQHHWLCKLQPQFLAIFDPQLHLKLSFDILATKQNGISNHSDYLLKFDSIPCKVVYLKVSPEGE